jgi:Protein of unknown function (DUF4038)/Domain of unknown function (DUF5060)/Putative collagen-binding domain of a collagenase
LNDVIAKWGRFEKVFTSAINYSNSAQQAGLKVNFTSPFSQTRTIDGFWDGGLTWRVRFSPDEIGTWTFTTDCSDTQNAGLQGQSGEFDCAENFGQTLFDRHGPLRLSDNRRYLVHTDSTPFFWLADTVWNGPLRSTTPEWEHYLRERTRQKFSAVQWVTTQWLAAYSDIDGQTAYTGREHIEINAAFFQRLDTKMDAINRAGLLAVPVLLWAAAWSPPDVNDVNPGFSLPENQAILLARYMVARWGAHHVMWILPGDADYRGEKAERWKNIGRAVFGDSPHAPVILHPAGEIWIGDDFLNEMWMDVIGYQSGHGGSNKSQAWLVNGPPATSWDRTPARPIINLEPPYENHASFVDDKRHEALDVRRAIYWSLLVSPTAGVTYGGHGVWGWDDGTTSPLNHPNTQIPLPWEQALVMPAAEQLTHLKDFFSTIEWWRLRPTQSLLVVQPGETEKYRFVAAAQSEAGDLIVIYVPIDRQITLNERQLRSDLSARWFNPRNGQYTQAVSPDKQRYETSEDGDWVLIFS